MTFRIKYSVSPSYLTGGSLRRPSLPMNQVRFIVAHDTGNPGSTAANNVAYYERSRDDMEASAHIFVDDSDIIECIPFLSGPAEKAWHVVYNTPIDNQTFGVDANDCAGGIELCYGENINGKEAYQRYVWVMAYACWRYGLDPATDITAHFILDPSRKIDPKNALSPLGITFEQFLNDVKQEYDTCIQKEPEPMLDKGVAQTIISTWISPAWHQMTGNRDQQDYLHWLANELRKAAGLDPE
ncbi:peptidoglycan recognition protein family protein [Paenibacillus rigui]|uniref:N-acetylmuramoyl-L-alanine amidase n=1 Tax=Paenibacillus rigui TaxID=554312 RepID=A0A229UU63_9BACL|nr:peptidoglycan recognition family protein [Paenibacillus rigui]OXM86449.1 N-acetylmuramoyl-L-alanine amidase [Paenibacillus rigui]